MSATEFLLLLYEDERAHLALPVRAMSDALDAQRRWLDSLSERHALRAFARLRPSSEGARVSRADDALVPRESEPSLSMFVWVRAASLEAATAMAEEAPLFGRDWIEVRPVMSGQLAAALDAVRARAFGFVVLGSAPTEREWTAVMDRIDRETRSNVRSDRFVGGVRLEAPSEGRSVRRAVFDGPFVEGRELVGGVFVMRMASLHHAIAWAEQTPFVTHGALEVRRLWRS